MLKSQSIEVLLNKWLSTHVEIELAILFGSYAKGTATRLSDIDIAVQLSSGRCIQAGDKLVYINQLTELLNVSVDLVDLISIGQPLLSQVIKYGRRLIGSQDLYAQLAIRNVNSSQDFIPYIERMLNERRRRWLADG